MFRSMIFLGALVALTAAAAFVPKNYATGEEYPEFVPIVKSLAEQNPDGSFAFAYEGADGSFREEQGHVINDDIEGGGSDIKVSGSYRYYDADGQLVEVHYTADKDGFVPLGTNIPHEITAAAKAAVEYARSHPADQA